MEWMNSDLPKDMSTCKPCNFRRDLIWRRVFADEVEDL
jgi:hypothetical protein